MAKYENILLDAKNGIAVVTINRPRELNALNRKTIEDIQGAFTQIRDDAEVTGAILTGAGERVFVAGADIGEVNALNSDTAREFVTYGQSVFNLIENLGKPIIACVNGFALGAGCEIALTCTFRYATKKIRIGLPEVGLGLISGYGGTQRLARLIGEGRAMELCLTGTVIDSDEAYRLGLVNSVFETNEEMLEAAKKTLSVIASKGPVAIRLYMESMHKGLSMPLPDALRFEIDLFSKVCGTEDMKEGTKAFLEKREPKFKGK
ncbi:MAG: enoyl-CoA hydratase-related protein [Planctomycetota bacterium]|jgi:enoyl-CoA hydratase